MLRLVHPVVSFATMGKLQAQYCTCPGCQGGGRKESPGHTTACTNFPQTEVIFGSYCGRCAPNYLCVRCKHNAAPGNLSGQICDVCGSKRCKCPGCSACGDSNMCTRNGEHTGYAQQFGASNASDHGVVPNARRRCTSVRRCRRPLDAVSAWTR